VIGQSPRGFLHAEIRTAKFPCLAADAKREKMDLTSVCAV
jgi:hypothetical protein